MIRQEERRQASDRKRTAAPAAESASSQPHRCNWFWCTVSLERRGFDIGIGW